MTEILTPRQIAVMSRIEKWKDHKTVSHIKALIKAKLKEQRERCVVEVMMNTKGSYYLLPTAQDRENIDNAIRNAPSPNL